MEFYLSINDGALFSAESQGVAINQRVLQNQGLDTVSISIKRRASEPVLWGTDAKVVIYRDGVRWFTGWSTKPLKLNGASQYGHHCTLRGPWQQMATASYRVSNGTAGPPGYTGGNPLPASPTSSVAWAVLKVFADPALAGLCTIPDWPASLVEVQYDLYPYPNGPVSEMFAVCLAYNVMAGTRFDYSLAVPALSVVNRLDSMQTLSCAEDGVISAPMQFRDDLWPQGIEIRCIDTSPGTPSAPYFTNPGSFTDASDCWPQTLVRGRPGNVVLYSLFDNAPQGMAKLIYDFLRQQIWEGTITVRGTATGVRPGDTINLTDLSADYDPDCATMGAVAQTVTENLLANITTITTGSHGHQQASNAVEFLADFLRLHPLKSQQEFGWWRFRPLGVAAT